MNTPELVTLAQARWTLNLPVSATLAELATRLLATGDDSPALRQLAGLDLAPYDPRDASDLFERVIEELGWAPMSREEAVRWVAYSEAVRFLAGRTTPRAAIGSFYSLALLVRGGDGNRSIDPPEIDDIASLDDAWNFVEDDELVRRVREAAGTLVARITGDGGLVARDPSGGPPGDNP